MSSEVKLRILIQVYRGKLLGMGFNPIEGPCDTSNNPTRVDIEHSMWMMDRIVEFIDEEDLERALNWFGFVQGCLWCCGILTINDMCSYNEEFADTCVA